MEKVSDNKEEVLSAISSWVIGEMSCALKIIEADATKSVGDVGKTLAFLFDLLEGDYILKWFDTATLQVLTTKVETGRDEFRWVFGPFQSFIAKLFVLHGEKEVRTLFRDILGSRGLAPLPSEKGASVIGFKPALTNTMQVDMGTTSGFFNMNPWAEALLATIAIVQADTEYSRLKPQAAILAKTLVE